jgi:hypothetical protein
MTSDAPPHSRWLIRESMDRLAASHDAVTVAVDALTRSAVIRSSAGDGPTIRQRITGGRGWSRTVWFGITTLLTGLFMAWISLRLVRHLSVAPDVVAVLPGLLLTLGLAVTALQAAKSLERPSEPGTSTVVVPLALLAAAAVGSVAWITLWLVLTTGAAAWAAVTGGVALVAAAAAGMLASARPAGTQAAAVTPRARSFPRRLRAQRSRAQRRLRDHTREWNLAAHQYGAAIDGPDEAADALARLLADDADLTLDGISPYDTLILTALCKYRPAPLTASFDAAIRYLHDETPHSMDARG